MTKLNTIPTIEFKTAESFETWLEKHHDNSSGLWIKIFKKDSGMKTISYMEALELALCYGWIDGQKQAYDEQAWLQKFCPRTAKSIWSKVNIGHVERLINNAKMRPAGLKAVEKAKADGRWEKAYDSPSTMTIPEDFLKELSKNKKADEFFKSLKSSSKTFSTKNCETEKLRIYLQPIRPLINQTNQHVV